MKDGRRGERKEMKSGGKEMVKGREKEERKDMKSEKKDAEMRS